MSAADRDELEALTKSELQDRLRDRDASVTGSKDELIDRLIDVDSDQGEDADSGSSGDAGDTSEQPPVADGSWTEHLDAVRSTVSQLTSFDVESFVGVHRRDDGDGWSYSVQVVENRRVPSTADLVSVFRVEVADSGALQTLERVARGRRDQVAAS